MVALLFASARLRTTPLRVSSPCCSLAMEERRLDLLAGALRDDHIDELMRERFIRIEDYISAEHVARLLVDIEGLRSTGFAHTKAMDGHGSLEWFTFGPGSVGAAPPIPPELGGDPEARWQLGKLVGNLHRSIEQGVGTSFDPDWTELQYAYYPLGGFYHKHIDSGAFHTHPLLADSPDGSRRLIKRACSFVLYLNDQWTEADGGHLRVYDSAAPDAAYRDVAPTAGTLVVFKSDEVLHEVMRSNARRVSIVGCAWPRTHGPNHSFSRRAPGPLLTALPPPAPRVPGGSTGSSVQRMRAQKMTGSTYVVRLKMSDE